MDLEMHALRDMRRTAAPDESEKVDNIFVFFLAPGLVLSSEDSPRFQGCEGSQLTMGVVSLADYHDPEVKIRGDGTDVCKSKQSPGGHRTDALSTTVKES